MVDRCDRVGVKIYVDFIPNHMSGPVAGVGFAGSTFDGHRGDYPGVPYAPEHFNMNIPGRCPTSGGIEDWGNAVQLRNCMLVGLRDLDQSQVYVRRKVSKFSVATDTDGQELKFDGAC